MEDNQPSRLQGAFINYLKFNHSRHENISEDAEKYASIACLHKDIGVLIFKFTFYITSLLISYIVIVYSSKEADYFLNLGYAVVVWICAGLLLFSKYIPFRQMFNFRKISCFPWSSSSTEDQGVQTEEDNIGQHFILRDPTEEQTLHQPTILREETDEQIPLQHDEIAEQTDSILTHKCLPSETLLNLRRIFGCPCYSPVDDDQEILTENSEASQLSALHDSTAEQSTSQSEELTRAASEENGTSAKRMTVEERLLKYLLGDDEEEESVSTLESFCEQPEN